jgi:hypothetical protein
MALSRHSRPRKQRLSLYLSTIALFLLPECSSSCHLFAVLLQLPPLARWTLGQADSLQQDCQKATSITDKFYWESDLGDCNYQLALRVFQLVAERSTTTSTSIWLPKLDREQLLLPFVQVLNDNSKILGGLNVQTSSWPKTPATRLQLSWPAQEVGDTTDDNEKDESFIQSAIQATEEWVEEKLCKLRLCPYTYSLQRAAVGLESMGVKEGPIVVRHASFGSDKNQPSAAVLALAFWQGVAELATKSEQQVATLLIVGPSLYDSQFLEFAAVFDNLIEPTVQATGAEKLVGRAIFHPTYEALLIGHSQILHGHALPAHMVEGFVNKYIVDQESQKRKPNLAEIAMANDAVRHTPHATINLLRRSQLQASKEAEAASVSKRPNWIYARNVLRILKSE